MLHFSEAIKQKADVHGGWDSYKGQRKGNDTSSYISGYQILSCLKVKSSAKSAVVYGSFLAAVHKLFRSPVLRECTALNLSLPTRGNEGAYACYSFMGHS